MTTPTSTPGTLAVWAAQEEVMGRNAEVTEAIRALMARCEQAELDAALAKDRITYHVAAFQESQAHAEQLAEALDTLLGESYNDIDQENAYAALAAWRERGSK